jgi:hypothetical protein
MSNIRKFVPAAGLLAAVVTVIYMVVQLSAQVTTNLAANFTNAAVAEVKDAQGQAVLQGQFVPVQEDDDDLERKAILKPTGVDADAAGEAEVEFAKAAPATQEVEFSVSGLQPGAAFTFVIDGQEVATATADRRGKAKVEIEVRMPGAR